MSLGDLARLLEEGDPDRFRTVMAAPVDARPALLTLYAFNLEIARAPWLTQEPMIAEMRLQWWLDALEEIDQGLPARQHEVVTPLAELIRANNLPVADLSAMVDARRWDIYAEGFQHVDDLVAHISAGAGKLAEIAARALGAPSDTAIRAGRIGTAGGIANWLISVPDYLRHGRHPLPDPPEQAIPALARAGLDRLGRASRREFGRAFPALWPALSARAVLQQALRDPGRVLSGTLQPSGFQTHRRLLGAMLTGRMG